MTRDGMPRAYLRIDPNIDQTHPDVNRFVRLLCAAARQPDRGRFRNLPQLQALFGKHTAHQFLERGDVVKLADGRIYVDGWDEWQEGDFTVAERMRRMRAKRRAKRDRVTAEASPGRTDVTTDAVPTSSSLSPASDVGEAPQPPTSGGRRNEGTNPRAIAARQRADQERERKARKDRARQRELSYLRGEITEATLADMNRRDAPLEEMDRMAEAS